MKSLVVLNDCMFTSKQQKYLKKTFTNVKIYTDTSTEKDAIERIGNRNIVIMDQFMFSLGEDLLKKCKNLQLIILNTTAFDKIDLQLLTKYKIKLANLRDYATKDVAEIGFGMILALNNKIDLGQKIVKGGDIGIKEYSHQQTVEDIWPGHPIIPHIKRNPLNDQTLGIIGLGNIGQRTAEIALGFDMRVLAFNRTKKYIPRIELVPLRRLLMESDIIYISLAYDPKIMRGFINKRYLALIKQDALLISVAHPDLLDLDYVIKNNSKFRGIGFDYLVTPEVRELFNIRKNNIIITPHLGSQSTAAYINMTDSIIEAAESFANGSPLYLVN